MDIVKMALDASNGEQCTVCTLHTCNTSRFRHQKMKVQFPMVLIERHKIKMKIEFCTKNWFAWRHFGLHDVIYITHLVGIKFHTNYSLHPVINRINVWRKRRFTVQNFKVKFINIFRENVLSQKHKRFNWNSVLVLFRWWQLHFGIQ